MGAHARALALLATVLLSTNGVQASGPIYADGDLAPAGAPDGIINLGDYQIAQDIVLSADTPSPLQLAHGDVFPPAAPDGKINIQDVLHLQNQLLSGSTALAFVKTIDLFLDGPAEISSPLDRSASVTLRNGGFKAPGATVVNNPYAIDSDDPDNIVWQVSVSGGVANVYLNTGNLSTDPLFDTGFDFSGNGQGQLVFDIRVNSLSANAALTVKMDSGYPALGQKVLSPSQYQLGEWRRVSVSFADLLANPGPGEGLDLSDVGNAFVIEVTGGDASFDLDNIFVSQACNEPDACSAQVKTKPEPAIFSLIWSDEFDGTALSSDNWVAETGYGSFGWGNDEWQLYTNSSANLFVQDGNLNIVARCAQPPNCGKRNGTITSARINTLGKFAFKYGKIEARLKPPVSTGMWPAFWMLGSNFPSVGWPRTGEIDIVEMNNNYSDEKTTHFTVHYCDDRRSPAPCQFDPGWQYDSQFKSFPYSLGDDYHIFSAEWDANGITGKIDGQTYFYRAIDPGYMTEFLEEFFTILNVAVGGTLGGAPDETTQWPQTMLVDYVRVYQADDGEGTYTLGAGPTTPELGIYSETHTDGVLRYANIINGADFGGNLTNTSENSTAVAPADGNVALAADYVNTGRSYGGFILNFGSGSDMSAYQSLRFAINTSAMPAFADMRVQLESPAGGQPAPRIQLADYTPVSISGNWAYYDIPLQDFEGQTALLSLTSIIYLGFWNPISAGGQLQFGRLYFDDIHLAGGE
ncbi:family 16 glycosylhydrolase [Candidatus Litorirhabdus singularis]|uniref:family 16 glycosylhydrolase n=1 Tax=Candidatus Litorirhabdus singularis TaxID=2518993 RepID=UPI00242E7D6C|nr:family 16 glycosylhydrolase [Candidatus Litorirhabdus singularis]